MVTVGIDFGTSGTTYAFAFNDSKDDINHAKWPDSPGLKNPTEIITISEYAKRQIKRYYKRF